MAKNISLLGADYPDVPAVQLPKTGGGVATFTDTEALIKRQKFSPGNVSVVSDNYATAVSAHTLTGYIPMSIACGWNSANNGFSLMLATNGSVYISAPNGTNITGLSVYIFYIRGDALNVVS